MRKKKEKKSLIFGGNSRVEKNTLQRNDGRLVCFNPVQLLATGYQRNFMGRKHRFEKRTRKRKGLQGKYLQEND